MVFALRMLDPNNSWHQQLGMEPVVREEMMGLRGPSGSTYFTFGTVASPEDYARVTGPMREARWTLDTPEMEGFTSEESEAASQTSSGRLLEAEEEDVMSD